MEVHYIWFLADIRNCQTSFLELRSSALMHRCVFRMRIAFLIRVVHGCTGILYIVCLMTSVVHKFKSQIKSFGVFSFGLKLFLRWAMWPMHLLFRFEMALIFSLTFFFLFWQTVGYCEQCIYLFVCTVSLGKIIFDDFI